MTEQESFDKSNREFQERKAKDPESKFISGYSKFHLGIAKSKKKMAEKMAPTASHKKYLRRLKIALLPYKRPMNIRWKK